MPQTRKNHLPGLKAKVRIPLDVNNGFRLM